MRTQKNLAQDAKEFENHPAIRYNSFPAVPAGTYTLKVEKKGHAPWTEEITVDSTAIAKDVTVYLLGDITMDGKYSSLDVAFSKRIVAGNVEVSDYQKALADINGDGRYRRRQGVL